jgi:hypothetical protein
MTATHATPPILTIPIADLDEAPDNENAMTAEKFALLVQAIQEVGFLQPILVERAGARWRIVDGVHRKRAAAEVGYTALPCVERHDDGKTVAVRIGMNNLRGQLNLAAVAASVATLHANGWSMDDLSLTGFTTDELDHLLHSAQRQVPDDVMEHPVTAQDEPEEAQDRPFVLELRYATKADLARAKRGLRKAIGKGGDMADGLLRLLDGA